MHLTLTVLYEGILKSVMLQAFNGIDRKIIHLTHQNATKAIIFPNLQLLFQDNRLDFSAMPASFLPRITLPLDKRGWN